MVRLYKEMPIPAAILAVDRPKNTVVIAYGKDKSLYAVRQRVGCKNVGGRHLPVNGPTIGHIVDGAYVPISKEGPKPVSPDAVDLKDWADIVHADSVFRDLLDELKKVYAVSDALKIYCIAILRVCNPGIKDNELKEAYDDSFLSELYPGVALSKNTVSTFHSNLGKSCSRIISFMQNRAAAVGMDHRLLIDGTLKSNESKVNTLSDFSRKAAVRGSRDISVLYAFDLDTMEPVCSKCFPGNMLDITAYESFISENNITRGLIIGDKGFPASAAESHLAGHPDLHYLNPVKRNSKLIERHKMLSFEALLPGHEGMTYKKARVQGKDKWLYSFRDTSKAAQEEKDYLKRAKAEGTYDDKEFRSRQLSFGTIVLECDLDLAPEIAYKAYAERWEIEIIMRYYKSAYGFDETRVHDDYSVIGSEFCDFLSTLLTFRLIKSFDKARVLERMTYGKAMSILHRAKKVRYDESGWRLLRINPSHEQLLQDIGLLPKPEEAPKRRPGRPKKSV
ncbi:MAG: transposase [Bacteroidales bacterium]|nr:transposase [Bacteroidales bacterium]